MRIAPSPAIPSSAVPAAPGPALLGWLAALATVVIWALWMVGTRHAVTHDLPPAAIGILRFGVPALVLAPVWWRTGLVPRRLPPLVSLGLLGSGAPFFLIVATGMRFAPAADVGPLLPGTMPLFVALIGCVLFGERLGRWRVLGFGLIALGIVSIGGRGLIASEDGAWRGHALVLTGAFLWGLYTHAYRRSGLTPVQGAALVGIWSVLFPIPFGAPALASALAQGLAGAVVLQAVLQGALSGLVAIMLYGLPSTDSAPRARQRPRRSGRCSRPCSRSRFWANGLMGPRSSAWRLRQSGSCSRAASCPRRRRPERQ